MRQDPGRGRGMIPGPRLTRAQRAADIVTEFCGSWTFIIVFSGITIGWMALNTIAILNHPDPYPYILLNLFLTVVSTFQSPLIMMSQNRQMERDRDAVQGLHAKLDELSARLPGTSNGADPAQEPLAGGNG